ncbi:MAG: hypothetical protein AAF208_01230 [Cyanobacteria bacterium P01_A01_bin.45]
MNIIDDTTLIKKFITGQVRLAFNKNLRVEPVSTTIQLFTKKGCLLATVNLANNLKSFFVRRDTEYWQLINQILLENSFMPISRTQQGLFKYEQRFVPAGYGMNYTEARILWKTWRIKSNQDSSNEKEIIIDLKVETKQGWEKIVNIEMSQENVFIRTATEELMLHICDCLVWISPFKKNVPKPAVEDQSDSIEKYETESSQNDLKTSSDAFLWTQLQTKETSSNKVNLHPDSHSDSHPNTFSSNSQNILNIYQGKLYIQTLEGEIVIEGSNLKFWFSPPPGHNFIPEPIEVKDYDKPVKQKNISREEIIINF